MLYAFLDTIIGGLGVVAGFKGKLAHLFVGDCSECRDLCGLASSTLAESVPELCWILRNSATWEDNCFVTLKSYNPWLILKNSPSLPLISFTVNYTLSNVSNVSVLLVRCVVFDNFRS